MSDDATHARSVGIEFIQLYYKMLTIKPEDIGRFYTEDATLSMENFVYAGSEEIKEAYVSKRFGDMTFEIETCSFAPTLEGAVLISVYGCLTSVDDSIPDRHVAQSLVLAPIEEAYFVVTDVIVVTSGESFHDGEESAPEGDSSAAASSATAAATEASVAESDATAEAADAAADHDDVAETAKPEAEEAKNEETQVETKKPETPAAVAAAAPDAVTDEPKEEEKEKAAAPGANFSYAQMLKQQPKKQAPPPASPAKASIPASGGKTAAATAPKQQQQQQQQQQGGRGGNKPASGAGGNKQGGRGNAGMNGSGGAAREKDTPARRPSPAELSRSLFVKDMPRDFSEAMIRETFEAFGPIASVELPSGKHFAFVNFESASAMKAACEAKGGVTMKGSAVHVEARSVTGGGRGGGRGGRGGAGGQRSGGSRGSGGRGGRGSGGNGGRNSGAPPRRSSSRGQGGQGGPRGNPSAAAASSR